MKKVATTILLIPFALAGGLFYGLIAGRIFREREPWFAITMLCGLDVSVCAMTWLTGASWTAAIGVFVGTGILYIALRLLFGSGSALEMFYVATSSPSCSCFCFLHLRAPGRSRDHCMRCGLTKSL
jgi:hypothetical protein